MMTRNILLVEDSKIQLSALSLELKDGGWNIVHSGDVDGALYQAEVSFNHGQPIEMAAIDLGLPPDLDNPNRGGILLIRKLRERFGLKFPIIAYTSMSPKEIDYSYFVKQLLSLRSSFVYLRPMDVNFCDVAEYVWKGYLFLSPVPTDFLTKAISETPDPLDRDHWETLMHLDRQINYAQIGNAMGLSAEGVKARVGKIKEILIDQVEIPADAQQDEIVQWYRQKKVRYSRP
jgi:CheY-like chemotaxis protein